jgi:hypothetical protein
LSGQRIGMTDAEFDRLMAPFAPLIERGYRATLALNRLVGDGTFRERYMKGDAEAIEVFNRLSALKAEGIQPYRDAIQSMQAAVPPISAEALRIDEDFGARRTPSDNAAHTQPDSPSTVDASTVAADTQNGDP